MAVKFRVQANYTTGGQTSLAIPAGVAVGDLLILVNAYRPTFGATPTGWTVVPGSNVGGGLGTTGAQQECYYKFATAADATPGATATYSAGTSNQGATMTAWSGVDTTTPFAFANAGSSSTSTTMSASGVTPTFANPTVVNFWTEFYTGGNAISGYPAGSTALAQSVQLGSAYAALTQAANTAIGVRTATQFTANQWLASTFALNPSTTVVAPTFRYGTKGAGSSGTTAFSVAVPPGANPGELALFHVQSNNATAPTPPSGVTLITSQQGSGGTVYWYVYQAKLTAAQIAGGSFAFTAAAAGYSEALCALYQDANATNAVPTSATAASLVAPSIAGAANSVLVALFGYYNNVDPAPTAPAGMTQRVFYDGVAASSYLDSVVFDQALGASGATGTRTMSLGSGSTTSPSAISLLVAGPNSPPNAPILTAPTNASYADLAAGYTFTWTFSDPNVSDTQTQYAFRRKISGAGAYEYWNAGTGAFQGTEVFNTSSAGSLTFAAGKWVNGNVYQWSVNTVDSAPTPLTGVYATDNTVSASGAPAVSVTAPTGTQVTQTPTIAWTTTVQTGLGSAQTAYRVVVEGGAFGSTPGSGTSQYDSGVVSSGAMTIVEPTVLVNATYRAFVQVTETGGQVSSWGFSSFTVALDSPATPVVVATWDAANQRAVVVVQGADNMLSTNAASIETDASAWTAGANTTVARSTAQFADGVASLSLTSTAAGAISASTATGTSGVAALPGVAYEALASFRTAVTSQACTVGVGWYNAAGALISTSTGSTVTDLSTGFTQAVLAATSPALTAYAAVIVTSAASAGAEVHYVDNISLAPGSSTTWTRGGLAGTGTALVQRTTDGGTTFVTVRGASAVPVPAPSQLVTVYDYEVTPLLVAGYRAAITDIV